MVHCLWIPDRALMLCLVMQQYIREARANRFNPFWHQDPPHNSCVMPHDNLPWTPSLAL